MRHQDFRNPRHREFNVDNDYRQPRAFGTRPRLNQPRFEAPPGPPVSGIVKWFSPEKGSGFVALSDGSGDAFLHGSVLAQSRTAAVQQGETLEVRVGPGHNGPHITEVLSIDTSTAAPPARRRSDFRATTSNGPTSNTPVEETGTVKRFNVQQGYGFITANGGGKDVFVQSRLLSGLASTGSSKDNLRSSMWSRAERVSKPREFA